MVLLIAALRQPGVGQVGCNCSTLLCAIKYSHDFPPRVLSLDVAVVVVRDAPAGNNFPRGTRYKYSKTPAKLLATSCFPATSDYVGDFPRPVPQVFHFRFFGFLDEEEHTID